MLSYNKYKLILKKENKELTDDQIREIIELLHSYAVMSVELSLKQKRNG
jgi:hypothetical protein|tara:strand:+ start:151 stop:297 length:147 start_codon:yes stop_codon:yes gene_type:complete